MTADRDAFAAALLEWFAVHGRHDLPWQAVRDPYRIWVSEIMLQQTQVTTVIPYFERFIARFPDVQSLAKAALDDVLVLWSGLGYYARARNLHRAAVAIVERHQGSLPQDHALLCALPGIGRSTASAILALAWNEPHAILDGNVKRVLARYHGVHGFPGSADVLARLWALAESHTPANRAAEYTQAIMDLGATLCVRGRARCDECPVANNCVALAQGSVGQLPSPRPKRDKPRRETTVLMLQTDQAALLLERRPPTGIWGGLLSLPELPADVAPDAWCRETLGIVATEIARLPSVRHGFTHFDLELKPVLMRVCSADTVPDPDTSCASSAGPADRNEAGAALQACVLDADRWLWYNTSRPLPGGVAAPIGRLIGQLRDTDVPGDRITTSDAMEAMQ